MLVATEKWIAMNSYWNLVLGVAVGAYFALIGIGENEDNFFFIQVSLVNIVNFVAISVAVNGQNIKLLVRSIVFLIMMILALIYYSITLSGVIALGLGAAGMALVIAGLLAGLALGMVFVILSGGVVEMAVNISRREATAIYIMGPISIGIRIFLLFITKSLKVFYWASLCSVMSLGITGFAMGAHAGMVLPSWGIAVLSIPFGLKLP